ncbi:MAG TPA: hypothetical protein ENG87_04280 [Candidatus Pacearchaeota archaeon]|nr:transcription elongation factor NusA-like protein [archaeon BMS3Abin17]HDK42572.1 hypothetical protein [Candidatus Pacearchaeota archaeon]HDZ60921.1 hypothetical protein [Candidatus Pacearchaeota archaeon]
MGKTINMQDMRYLNLFRKMTRISTRFCFKYNETIVFCVPKNMISKALGENGRNIKKMSEILRKKIKIVPKPRNIEDSKIFIQAIVNPVRFKDLNINDNEMILTAGNQSKAALIGRNKRRLLEMQEIVRDFFGKEFRIV